MKKKYITLEEVLALRGTDTKIYKENTVLFFKFFGDLLCAYDDEDNLCFVGECLCYHDKLYIIEQEEFKVEKTGLYKTRDGRTAYVSYIDSGIVRGVIEGNDVTSGWFISGGCCKDTPCNDDLVEYIGD